MGVALFIAGLTGIVFPGFLGMHLSAAHNLIHLSSGALALWVGYSEDSRKAYTYCLAFGAIYGVLAVLGFLIGQPGYPSVGHMEADQNLLRVIPNILEFGTSDHVVHLFISAILLFSAFLWKKDHERGTRGIVDVQRRRGGVGSDVFRQQVTDKDLPNSRSNLSRAELGKSDVNRNSDIERRRDFEGKI